jgi:hypothetical protein
MVGGLLLGIPVARPDSATQDSWIAVTSLPPGTFTCSSDGSVAQGDPALGALQGRRETPAGGGGPEGAVVVVVPLAGVVVVLVDACAALAWPASTTATAPVGAPAAHATRNMRPNISRGRERRTAVGLERVLTW